MIKAQHTAGPWEWYWREVANEADCGVMSGADSGRAISVCRAPRYERKQQWEANASLISAAPDLLEALRGLCEADRDDLNDSTSTVWNDAVAAIAKATGGGHS